MSDATTVLEAADEVRLAKAIEAGLLASERLADGGQGVARADLIAVERAGREAWQRFLLANVRLVQSIAAQEARRSTVGLDELFQEGFLGLTDALVRWDYACGYRFSTYAAQWIRRRVVNASVDHWVQASVRTALRARGVRGLAEELTGELRRAVTDGELAILLGRSERWVARMRSLPMLAPLEPGLVADVAPVDPEPDTDVRALLPDLPRLEAQLLRARFGLDGAPALRQRAAAEALGLSLSTLRRVEARALRRLRGRLLADLAA
ncbi:MAG: sigma-70 family RNA polymerase sigma factor [Micropruina sp.]|uniref:sigma-70 family RNA polymerase sigma factor n=1 Tax=Micropruina sp. TaxID=2737536 RepID=UPI0039E637BA